MLPTFIEGFKQNTNPYKESEKFVNKVCHTLVDARMYHTHVAAVTLVASPGPAVSLVSQCVAHGKHQLPERA